LNHAASEGRSTHHYIADKLLKLTDLIMDMDVPRIYHEMANQKKGMGKQVILQHCFDKVKDTLKLSNLPASPMHVINLENWDFFGTTIESLGTGLLPASIVPPDALSKEAHKAMAENQEQARQFNMSHKGVPLSAVEPRNSTIPKVTS
jgi:hypothetical protein